MMIHLDLGWCWGNDWATKIHLPSSYKAQQPQSPGVGKAQQGGF